MCVQRSEVSAAKGGFMTITKRDVADTLYLSCVENYFLAWLGKIYDVTKLYGSSFVGIGQIFDDFSRGATYENYCNIPRLQDVAEEYGIVRHEYKRCSAKDAVRVLREQPKSTLSLARVNMNFFEGYKRASWREDHYICLDGELHWLNQYPLSEGKYDFEQFCRIYDGAVILYKPSNLQAFPPDLQSEEIARQSFCSVRMPERLSGVESAIGVLRVTRRRMEKYYTGNKNLQTLLQKEVKLLDEIYFLLRLKQIKQQSGADKAACRQRTMDAIEEPLEKVFAMEREVAEDMRNGS